jgi:hypothetical protein
MARRPHASRIKAKTARLQLPVRQKPYDFTEIAVGYRRCRNRRAVADDYEDADGDHARLSCPEPTPTGGPSSSSVHSDSTEVATLRYAELVAHLVLADEILRCQLRKISHELERRARLRDLRRPHTVVPQCALEAMKKSAPSSCRAIDQ